MPTWKRCLPLLLTVLFLAPMACQDAKPPEDTPTGTESGAAQAPQAELPDPNIRFGMPALATSDPANREAFLLSRKQYVLSFNDRTHNPNWVAWRLTQDDIGKAKRGAFQPDPLLPRSFGHVTAHTYDGSGFDRGHQCPAQDRSSGQEDMDATFYTTNIVPQSPHCNQRGWERLEAYSRTLTRDGHVLWIACGPVGVGGEGKEGKKDVIGKGLRVTVPAKLWKVILVLPGAEAKPTKQSRTIAVIMPNDQSVDFEWAKYRCSVSQVERLTGVRFWPAIPEETAKVLKEKTDEVKIREPKSKKAPE